MLKSSLLMKRSERLPFPIRKSWVLVELWKETVMILIVFNKIFIMHITGGTKIVNSYHSYSRYWFGAFDFNQLKNDCKILNTVFRNCCTDYLLVIRLLMWYCLQFLMYWRVNSYIWTFLFVLKFLPCFLINFSFLFA